MWGYIYNFRDLLVRFHLIMLSNIKTIFRLKQIPLILEQGIQLAKQGQKTA